MELITLKLVPAVAASLASGKTTLILAYANAAARAEHGRSEIARLAADLYELLARFERSVMPDVARSSVSNVRELSVLLDRHSACDFPRDGELLVAATTRNEISFVLALCRSVDSITRVDMDHNVVSGPE